MADVNYKIGADATAVVKEIGKVKKTLAGLGKMNWASVSMGVQSIVANLAMLKNLAVGAFDAIIKPAAEVEQFMVRFQTVLGDSKKASQHMAGLRKYASQTPFELSDIAEASGVLLGFGVEAEKSNEVLRQMGDVAAITGASLKDLALIYGKVAAVGLETETVNQLAERQVNVRALLAARDGISIAEVQKNISKKKYGIADLDYVLGATTGKGGLHFEGAIKQAQTLSGIMSTFKDNLTEMAATVGEQFTPALKDGVAKLAKYLPAIQGALVDAVEPAKRLFGVMIDLLPQVARLVTDTVKGLAYLSEKFQAFVNWAMPIGEGGLPQLLSADVAEPEVFKRQRAFLNQPRSDDPPTAAEARREEQAELERAERAIKLEQQLEKQRAAAQKSAESEAFGKRSAVGQARALSAALAQLGYTGRLQNVEGARAFLDSAQGKAAAAGDSDRFERISVLREQLETLLERADSARAARLGAHAALARQHIVEGGNAMQLARYDATQSAWAMAQQYLAAGMGQQEATRLAATQAAKGMQLPELAAGQPATIAQSRVAVGGGGTSIRIGDAQLDVARRHLNIAEEIKRVMDNISAMLQQRSGSAIPVVV